MGAARSEAVAAGAVFGTGAVFVAAAPQPEVSSFGADASVEPAEQAELIELVEPHFPVRQPRRRLLDPLVFAFCAWPAVPILVPAFLAALFFGKERNAPQLLCCCSALQRHYALPAYSDCFPSQNNLHC